MSIEIAKNFEKDLQTVIETYSLLLEPTWIAEILTSQVWNLEGRGTTLEKWYEPTSEKETEEEKEEKPMLFKQDYNQVISGFDWYKDEEIDGSLEGILKTILRKKIEECTAIDIARLTMLLRIKNPVPKKEGQSRYNPDKALTKSQRKQIFESFGFNEDLAELEKEVVNLHGKQNKEVLKSVQIETVEEYGEEWMEKVETSHLPPLVETEKKRILSPLERFLNPNK